MQATLKIFGVDFKGTQLAYWRTNHRSLWSILACILEMAWNFENFGVEHAFVMCRV